MHKHHMYVRIVGEPFLSRVKQYRVELAACHSAWREFALARGADEIPGGMSGLIFHDRKKVPAGWNKTHRNGWACPRKGSPDHEAMKALPKPPSSHAVFGDSIVDQLNYEGPEHSGSGAIGYLFSGPSIGWAGDTFFAVIPNAKAAVADHLSRHPNDRITNGADKWALPDGLVEISEAEHDLIVAQYQVEQERGAVAA